MIPEIRTVTYVKCGLPLNPLLLSISVQTYLENYRYLWDDEGVSYLEKFYNKETFLRDLQNPSYSYHLIYVDGEIAGYFKTKINSDEDGSGTRSMYLDKLYILKAFIGKRIGTEVLLYMESLAKIEGIKVLSLQVMDCSPAKTFYLKNNYKQIEQTRLGYPLMKKEYNLILSMEKTIA
jgi:GNAT superfamily N-acetyltransferase